MIAELDTHGLVGIEAVRLTPNELDTDKIYPGLD